MAYVITPTNFTMPSEKVTWDIQTTLLMPCLSPNKLRQTKEANSSERKCDFQI